MKETIINGNTREKKPEKQFRIGSCRGVVPYLIPFHFEMSPEGTEREFPPPSGKYTVVILDLYSAVTTAAA